MTIHLGDTMTEAQKEVYDWLVNFIDLNSFPPTRSEIAKGMGVSVNAIQCHLAYIEAKGFIEIVPSISRGIRIC